MFLHCIDQYMSAILSTQHIDHCYKQHTPMALIALPSHYNGLSSTTCKPWFPSRARIDRTHNPSILILQYGGQRPCPRRVNISRERTYRMHALLQHCIGHYHRLYSHLPHYALLCPIYRLRGTCLIHTQYIQWHLPKTNILTHKFCK